jgi:hypothetical protein
MKRLLVPGLSLALLLLAGSANASIIVLTIPEYSSPYHDVGIYLDPYVVGTFNFTIPAQERITSASISGTWGNSEDPITAHNLLFVDLQPVASTYGYSPDPRNNDYVPWSYNFSDFSVLNDGVADFLTVQTSEYYVRLGETTLTINTAVVPVPPTVWLLGSGLIGLLGLRRSLTAH